VFVHCCSIGIDDVMPREKLLAEKAKTLDKGYTNVQVHVLSHVCVGECVQHMLLVPVV
jgi:hypothetical protein